MITGLNLGVTLSLTKSLIVLVPEEAGVIEVQALASNVISLQSSS